MLRLFAQVKASLPGWYQLSLNNNILEITAEGVGVGHVQGGVYKFDGYFEFKHEPWPNAFVTAVQVNASRFPLALPGS